jgi:3-oxoacyl-ACP reductase-like protein
MGIQHSRTVYCCIPAVTHAGVVRWTHLEVPKPGWYDATKGPRAKYPDLIRDRGTPRGAHDV